MNLEIIKDQIKDLYSKEITLKVVGNRSKKSLLKGYVSGVYPRIFTVNVDGVNKSFSYSDVATGEVKIY